MNCEKCGKEIDGTYGCGKFCSRKCSNSRIFSEESNRKKSEANIKRYVEKGSWGGVLPTLTEEQRKEVGNKRREFCKNVLLNSDFDSLSIDRKKKRILIEQDYKCFECGIKEWRGKKIPLELDHKNGDHGDNKRENLVVLCPNCHSITPNWRGRNKTKCGKWLSSQEIYSLFKSGKNIRQILLQMGLAAKGANYIKAKRMIERFEDMPLAY